LDGCTFPKGLVKAVLSGAVPSPVAAVCMVKMVYSRLYGMIHDDCEQVGLNDDDTSRGIDGPF